MTVKEYFIRIGEIYMKRKKGFTLIELIAVLVIMAILALIVILVSSLSVYL